MSQEASSVVTQYLLDTQPGLAKVIASKTGSDVTRFVHDPMGIHSQEEPDGSWLHMAKDGLGSVRQVFDEDLAEVYAAQYAPYSSIWESSGTDVTPFKFTGEPLDANGLQYHRARYLDPALGVWMSLDPLETANRYGYVNANPVNFVDLNGLWPCDAAVDKDKCLDAIQNRLVGSSLDNVPVSISGGSTEIAGITIPYIYPSPDFGQISFAHGGALLGMVAPESGGSIASDFLYHYIYGNGSAVDLPFERLAPVTREAVYRNVDQLFRSTITFQDICSTCSNNTLDLNLNVQDRSVRRHLDPASPEAAWYHHLNLTESLKIKDEIRDAYLLEGGQVVNPYYSAYGGVTFESAGGSTLKSQYVSSTTKSITIETPVEVWDLYNWCFADEVCLASGTHPYNMRVGHFIALERAGRANQFHWYSGATVRLTYTISCLPDRPLVMDIQKSFSDRTPNMTAEYIRTTDPVDNWPADPNFPLFPTEDQLSTDGAVNWQ